MAEGVITIWRLDSEEGTMLSRFIALADFLAIEERAELGARLLIFFSVLCFSVAADSNLADKNDLHRRQEQYRVFHIFLNSFKYCFYFSRKVFF